ncbi:hypothetical protein [Enterococcus gallinarum]|uniref:spr1630 family ClpXP-sensitive toxin n=1 Tax=Enterococcus gallinarum TaxID=1353 RepID=UPI0018A93138|nr:hypothetical protein [Enterococcus gallinarum]
MENVVLNAEEAQLVVDGLLLGYKEYLDIRKEMKEKLKVSAGFAFTKGNFIDDGVARKTVNFADNKLEKAGESWEYLEFSFGGEKPSLFIVKNDHRLQQTFSKDKKKKTSQYLADYATINKPILNLVRKGQKKVPNISIQLELPLEEPLISKEELSKYENFYIVVYKANAAKVIESVLLVLPDNETKELHLVQNLTPYLQTTSIIIEDEEYSAVVGEKEEVGDLDVYDYTIPKEGEEISN